MSRASGKPGKEFWLAALRHEGAAVRAVVSDIDVDTPVPSCPGWNIGEVLWHLCRVYRWVGGHVVRGVTERPDPHRPPRTERPPDDELIGHWDEAYGTLLRTLDHLDAELPAWNWAPQAKKAGFWHRRMAHETAVHRWDAQTAMGLTEPIETKLAVDGVAEVLDTWLPGGRRKGPTDGSGLVQLVATDVAHEWLIRVRGGGVSLLDTSTVLHEAHRIHATASGTSSDLQLALWGRVPYDVLETSGDERLLEALRTG